jgi:hypothetical protein
MFAWLALIPGLALLGEPLPSNPGQLLGPSRDLVQDQLDAALWHALVRREPFSRSSPMCDPDTLNHFFGREDYQLLAGNPWFGYYHVGGFQWPSGVAEVAFSPPKPACPGARAIQPQAWQRAMALVAKAHGLRVRPEAPIRIRGAVVLAQVQPSASGSGPGYAVVTEYRVHSPNGVLLYRLGSVKRTLADAIGANLDFLVGFAQGLGDGASGGKP